MNQATSQGRVGSDQVLGRRDRVVARQIAGETLLVPICGDISDMHRIFALNPVAAHIWGALDGATSVRDLVADLCATFEVDQERARHDVTAFLDQLLAAGLIQEAG